MRTPKILIRLAVLLITAAGVLFAGIIYEGNEYTETMMPYSYSGSNENFIVISGSIDNYNSSRLSIFEINGVNMNNSSELPAAEDGKKYFIHLKGQNKNASFSVSGINDWSVEQPLDTTAIILPFTKTGEGRYFFSANQQIASVSSSGMDTLLINESDYTNLSSTELPESVEGHYYIYYRATSASAQMKLQPFGIPPAPDIDTTEIAVPYTKTGAGKHYFSTTDNIGSLTSVNMDTLLINNRVFSN